MEIRKDSFVTLFENDGEYTACIYVDKVDKDEISGLTIYTSSAYGSSVVRDAFETGRRLTLQIKDITDVKYCNNKEELQKELDEGIKRRESLARTIIRDDEKNIVQSIDFSRDNDGEKKIVFTASLPHSEDDKGIPVITQFFYYPGEDVKKHNIEKALSSRKRYYSSSGDFLLQTIVLINGEQIGTLEKYDMERFGENKEIANIVLDGIKNEIKA